MAHTHFEEYSKNLVNERLFPSVMYMGIPVFLGWTLFDYHFTQSKWALFLIIRVSVCTFLAIMTLTPAAARLLGPNSLARQIIMVLVLGTALGWMTLETGGIGSPYYSGINFVAIGSLAFWPMGAQNRALLLAANYGPISVLAFLLGYTVIDISAVLAVAFMSGTALLAFLTNGLSYAALRREFEAREALQDLIKNKDRIIEVKSAESANLKRLAKQFSPRVIEAIETKAISLDQRMRKDVAVMFIDVVGSTNRANQIDHFNYQKALDLFFGFAIRKLLDRNITVANFMGDGLMAITNAPYPMADFEQHAVSTGLEILKETEKRNKQLRELWLEKFEIRIGIASGYSTVGFFPNTDFGVYTALGESVNLAARLCTAAGSGTIATTKSVILGAKEVLKDSSVRKSDSIGTLKGFAGRDIEYFIITPESKVDTQTSQNLCPLCNSDLRLESDLGDTVLVKCTKCQFTDIETKSAVTVVKVS